MTTTDEAPPDDGGTENQGGLGRLAAHGAFWSFATYGGTQVIRLGSNLILTRLLFEEAFGLMALVSVFLTGLQLFSDLGIGASIVQNEKGDDRDFIDTAWTVQGLRGLLLWVISAIGAIPFARFYDEPQLAYLVPVTALAALTAGFVSTKIFSAQRHLKLKQLFIIDTGSTLVGALTMLAWAMVHRSVWALAIGGVIGTFARLLMSHFMLKGPINRFRWHRDSLTRLIHFGRWIFLSTIISFLVNHSDRLIFGKMVPVAMLGVYSIGAGLASLPQFALAELSHRVLFPLCSRVWNEKGDLANAFRKMRIPILILGGWMLSGFMAGGQTIIDILYDDRYGGAGWVLQLLAVGGWFSIMESTAEAAFLARGEVYWLASFNVAKLIGMVTLIPLGNHYFGFPGAVAGYAGADFVRYLLAAGAMTRARLRSVGPDLLLSLVVGISASAAYAATGFTRAAGVNVILEAVMIFVLVSALWSPLVFMVWRQRRGL